MQANSGNGLYIRKGHSGAFKTSETISASSNTKWMPVTSVTTSDSTVSLAGATSFAGSFGTLKGIKSDDTTKLEYTALGTVTADNDAYTATVNEKETNGVYYNFQIDYMITAGKSLKVTATDVSSTGGDNTTTDAKIAQAARVGIMPATSYNKDDASKNEYGTGKEYTIAEPAGTDYNLEELKALGYTGASEYKTGLTRLDTDGVTFASSSLATTEDKAFEYGSLNIYVWFDGTDKACTNAIFSQKVTMK